MWCLPRMHYSPEIEARDKHKKISCEAIGITLITVPYWWNGELSSLATTVHKVRPDIPIPSLWFTSVIPVEKPVEHRKTLCMIP